MPKRFATVTIAFTSALSLWLATSRTYGAGLPTATTLGATNITSSSVTVNGQINPNGAATTAYFELGTTSNYGRSTATVNAGSGTLPALASANFNGLSASTLQHYRVVAFNSFGTNFGADATFTTSAGPGIPPTVTTPGATNITTSSVNISGQINPNGSATTAYFELGTTTNYGTSTTINAGSGSSPVTANADFNGLFPGTLYHYRAVAFSSFVTNFGVDATFTTLGGLAIAPTAVDTNAIAPGHFVWLRQAAPAFGNLTNITAAEALLSLVSSNSAVAFDAYDVGVATVNYADFATSSPPQGQLGLDRDIHAMPGNTAPVTDQNNYAMEMTGYIYIPQAGSWTFHVNSDEGFRLRMGAANAVVTEFTGTRTPADSSAVVSVPSAGYYHYQLTCFEFTSGSEVEFSAGAPGQQILRLVGDPFSSLPVYHDIELPRLNIASQASQVVLSWPLKSGAWTLQSNTNLDFITSWVTVSPAPVVTAGQYVVTNNANTPAQFYRLKLP